MSELTYNLSQIYNCKLAIKAAIGTQSDELADYAGYITALKPDGYTYVTVNGDHNVAGYAYVSVAVDGSTEYENTTISVNGDYNIASYAFAYVSVPIPAGYVLPAGTYNVTANGTYVVGDYASVDVNVPIDWTSVGQTGYVLPAGTITCDSNGVNYDVKQYAYAYINVAGGGGTEPESYTLEGGLFINGQGQYYIADEGDLADYINIIPKEDVTGTWSDKFSYLTVGKDTTITGYNYYNGDAGMAIQAESYTQSSSIAYQTARLANIEPYVDKEYYGLGRFYNSAYITVNRSFNNPLGIQLGIPREVYGYYFPNSSYTNRYKDLMVDVSYIVPAGDDIEGLCATAMAFGNTTYALDLRNIRYCEDYMVYSSTYVTSTVGIDGGIIYYEIDLTQSGNYDDSNLEISFILSGGAFFAEIPNNIGQNAEPLTVKLEIPNGTFVFDEADWVFLSNNEEMTTGSVVFNEDHNNNPVLQIDTSGVWATDEFGNWNTTGVGELTVNGINSLKIRFYVDSSDNTWQYDWLIDVDYEWTPDGEEPEPEE